MQVRRYILSYDIADPKRLRRVERVASAYGDRIQYSVYQCDLQRDQRRKLEALLRELTNWKEDSVIIIDITKLSENDILQLGDQRITIHTEFLPRVI